MINQNENMTCEEFQAHMPEMIGSGEDASAHPHVQKCDLCRALLQDLETIAEAARQLFPVEDPPDRLWDQIESAIRKGEPGDPELEPNEEKEPSRR